jgi:hypothetical protein
MYTLRLFLIALLFPLFSYAQIGEHKSNFKKHLLINFQDYQIGDGYASGIHGYGKMRNTVYFFNEHDTCDVSVTVYNSPGEIDMYIEPSQYHVVKERNGAYLLIVSTDIHRLKYYANLAAQQPRIQEAPWFHSSRNGMF